MLTRRTANLHTLFKNALTALAVQAPHEGPNVRPVLTAAISSSSDIVFHSLCRFPDV